MILVFDDAVRTILDGKNFAVLATVRPEGAPQSSVLWFLREDDTLLISTVASRQKARNLAADPRVSVSIFDRANPYASVEIRGRAELIPDDENGCLGRSPTSTWDRTRRRRSPRRSGASSSACGPTR